MPHYFHFKIDDPRGNLIHILNEPLQSMQCDYVIPRTGQQCRRQCVIGLPCCHSHLSLVYKVKIGPSTLPGAGKGLFVYDKTKGDRAVVFRNNEDICPYFGDVITRDELEARYQDKTAPYGFLLNNAGRTEDAALHRGVGSLINHKALSRSNCKIYVKRNTGRAFVKASKNITNGSELFTSYGSDYRLNEVHVRSATNNRRYFI
jgi:hypothetical protein